MQNNRPRTPLFLATRHISTLCAGIAMATAMPAMAQLEEVIVTAQHREQNIQDVPITVTALSSDFIAKADIFDAASIAVNVPGFSFAEFAPGQALMTFRGVGSSDDGAGLDSSAATFLDGVYIGRFAGVNFDLFDLDRIEVLKGPQGALFGRNAIGGVISIVTTKPEQEFAAKAGLTVGNEGIVRYQGYVSGGLTENLSGKLVVNHREHDGYTRNTLLDIDVNDEDQTSFRGQLRWEGDKSDWLLSADTMEDDRAGVGRYPLVNGNFDYVGTAERLGANRDFTSASPTEGFSERDNTGFSLQGDIDFNGGTLTTITGVRNVESSWEMPSIGAPAGGGDDLANGVFGVDVIDDIEEEIDTFSQELRWTSNSDGAFNYVVGLYYFTEETDRQEQFRLDRNTVATGQGVVGNEWTNTENETTSYAVYGQGSYDINDQWALTVGARYTEDERDYVASAANCGLTDTEITAAGLPLSVCTFTGLNNDVNGNRVGGSLSIINETFIVPASDTWNNFSPMITLQYRPNDDMMVFATVSTGYKAGGFAGSQGVAAAADSPVDPEEVINYEAGFKGDFFDNQVRLNTTVFYMDYTDLQIVRFGPVPGSEFGTFQTTNVGQADIYGLEMDFVWQISENFLLSGNYAYLDTEANDLVIPAVGDFSGSTLRQAPENTYSIVAEYTVPSGMGDFDFRAQFSGSDDQHFDFATQADTVSPSHEELDLSARWTAPDQNYQLSLWVKNATDEAYAQHVYRIGPGSIGAWNAPRTYGLTGTWEF
ncbi:MAG: TonB-dependent receptor [Halioglobus sp.]